MFLIPVLVIAAIFALYQHRNKRIFGSVSLIICIYLLMGLSAVVLYFVYDYRALRPVGLEPMTFLALSLAIAFYGLFSYSNRQTRVLLIENAVLLRRLEIFQIVSSVGAMVFFFPFALGALAGNINENRWNLGNVEEALGAYGLVNSVASLAGNLFFLSIVLAFINLSTIGRGGSVRRAKLLLACSSVNIVYTIAYVGRDGLVFWLFTFGFLYLLFRDFLPRAETAWVRRMARLIVVPAVIGFSLITMSRFSDRDDSSLSDQGSVLEWLFVYAGSQIFNFSEQYVLDAPPTGGIVYFNEIVKLTGQASNAAPLPPRDDWWGDYTSYGVEPWRFQTFIGSLVIDFSRLGALALTIGLAALTRLSLRKQARTGVFSFSAILCFIILSQVLLFGVFYYRQFSTFYTQIGTLLIALTFKLFRSQASTIAIEKIPEDGPRPPWLPAGKEHVRAA